MKIRTAIFKICNTVWRHKYIWTAIIYIVIVGFVDDNSFLRRFNLAADNNKTSEEIKRYEALYHKDCQRLHELKSNPQALIRVAREDHQMKSPDEDVYYTVNADSIPNTNH